MKEWITGRNPVFECLRANRRHFFRLWLAEGIQTNRRVSEIIDLAKAQKIDTSWLPHRELDEISFHSQGIALEASGFPYVNLGEIIQLVKVKKEPLLLLLLDQLQDPQNLGTLIRSAELFGVNGVIIPPSRAAGVTPAVVSSSSGACEHLLIARSNLAQAIDQIKDHDGWVIGLDMDKDTRPIQGVDLNGNIALAIGSEGSGLRRLVKEKCDILAHIPTRGRLDSLNAAAAGSIVLFEAFLQRNSAQ